MVLSMSNLLKSTVKMANLGRSLTYILGGASARARESPLSTLFSHSLNQHDVLLKGGHVVCKYLLNNLDDVIIPASHPKLSHLWFDYCLGYGTQ